MFKPLVAGYFRKPCQNEWIRNWFKVPWFGDYSLPCERCGRKVWPWTKHQF